MFEFSIVTIIKGRRIQLANLLSSIKASSILPLDIHIVCMDDMGGIETDIELNVCIHLMQNNESLPLAAARNKGFAAAKTNNVIFIDVDCIVSTSLFKTILQELNIENIIAAYPLYLKTLPDHGSFAQLKPNGIPHPARINIPVGEPVPHLQFWSLIFAIKKETFEKIGGFDESFTGYGAEDTDFAMSFHKAGIEQIFVKDFVLHQYHDKYDPPLNYFNSIIKNAQRYHQKWQVLPMQSWLRTFEKLGLIYINEANHITVIKPPTNEDFEKSFSDNPY